MNNVKFSATPPTPNQAQDLVDKLKESLGELEKTKDNAEKYQSYIPLESQAKTNDLIATTEATIALLETYIETGTWEAPGASTASPLTSLDPAEVEQLNALPYGFNGSIIVDESNPNEIFIENSGNSETQSQVIFKADETVSEITGKTVGEDILVSVLKTDGSKEHYILKGAAKMDNINIVFYAGANTTPVKMDMSQVIISNDGSLSQYGAKTSLQLIGGSGDDTLIGSMITDTIIGGLGNDTLLGMGSDDKIYGDDIYDAGTTGAAGGGNDTIDAGVGADEVYAGSGFDTVTTPADEATVYNAETKNIQEEMGFTAVPDGSIQATGWNQKVSESGEVILTANDNTTKNIDITLPEGFDMAYAEQSGMDLVITMVKQDGTSIETSKITINNFYSPTNQTSLNVYGNNDGNIIDFHDVDMGVNTINIAGKGGDDTILGAAAQSAIDLADVSSNPASNAVATSFVESTFDSDHGGEYNWGGIGYKDAKSTGNGIVELTAFETYPGDNNTFALDAYEYPEGFTEATLMKNDNGDYQVVFKGTDDNGDPQYLTVVIKGSASWDNLTLSIAGNPIPFVGTGVTLDGGDGSDTIYYDKGANATVNAEKKIGQKK